MSGLSLAQRIAARGLDVLLADVARDHHVTPSDVLSKKRTKAVQAAREAFIAELYGRELSSTEIGDLVGRDHSSVLYALRKARPRAIDVARAALRVI